MFVLGFNKLLKLINFYDTLDFKSFETLNFHLWQMIIRYGQRNTLAQYTTGNGRYIFGSITSIWNCSLQFIVGSIVMNFMYVTLECFGKKADCEMNHKFPTESTLLSSFLF